MFRATSIVIVYPKPDVSYSFVLQTSVIVQKTIKNTSMSHSAALDDMFLHPEVCGHGYFEPSAAVWHIDMFLNSFWTTTEVYRSQRNKIYIKL